MRFDAIVNVVMRFFVAYLPYFALAAALFFVVKGKYARKQLFSLVVFLAFALLLANGIIAHTLHMLGYSFPSSGVSALVALGLGMFFFERRAGWTVLGTALLYGLGQVQLGLHTPLGVALGIATGCVALAADYFLLWRLWKPRPERDEEVSHGVDL